MKFKKTLLALGSIAAVVAPVTAVVACSDAESFSLGDGAVTVTRTASKITSVTIDVQKLAGWNASDLGKLKGSAINIDKATDKDSILAAIAGTDTKLVLGTSEAAGQVVFVGSKDDIDTKDKDKKKVAFKEVTAKLPLTFDATSELFGAKDITAATANEGVWELKFDGNFGDQRYLVSMTLKLK